MGEQFVDLFTAGAYALVGRIDAALASPSLAWLFYLLAAAGLIAAGSILGGQLGARIGRKLPPAALRAVIVCVGVAALVKLLA